jgi:hypothetical protein
MERRSLGVISAICVLGAPVLARAEQVVQIPLDGELTGRAVITFTDGKIVPYTKGTDRNDGLMTLAAETYLKQTGVALPDDGIFPANARHPEIVLHFSNAAPSTSQQNLYLEDVSSFELPLPQAQYRSIFVFMTDGANGAGPTGSPLKITLAYSDGTSTSLDLTWPDYGTGAPLPTDPPIFFNLIEGMHKWNAQNQSVDTPTHSITGAELMPTATKECTRLRIDKLNTGHVIVFWGATGIATSPLDAGPSSGADASDVPHDDASSHEAEAGSGAGGDGTGDAATGSTGGGHVIAGAGGDIAMGVDGSAGAAAPSSATSAASGCGCSLGPRDARLPTAAILTLLGAALRRRRSSVTARGS